ncbi:MAG: hypothetical protein PHY55_04250 [Bacteroidales bacterium]|nr:hypothetical protein [Bacteroidales bacterium]
MAEVNASAYQDLRDYIQANWNYIELQDEAGNPIIRKDITDARVTWNHLAGAQTLELKFVVTGSDVDISSLLPLTFAKSAIFKVATGDTAFSTETFTSFTISSAEDQLTIIHKIEVPQVI